MSAEVFAEVATLLARAEVLGEALQAMALARLTALQKSNGGVRGIATGDALRRLVARTLARKYAARFDNATRPFLFALPPRRQAPRPWPPMLRAAVELDADTVVSQGEGCEQGVALAPALFALAVHDALQAAQAELSEGDCLLPSLTTCRASSRAALESVAGEVARCAGVQANAAKTSVYRATPGPAPADLGPDVWRADKPVAERGRLMLGSALGSAKFVAAHGGEHARAEEDLLQQLPELPEWLLLSQCADPRSHHVLRTVPPSNAHVSPAAYWAAFGLRGLKRGTSASA